MASMSDQITLFRGMPTTKTYVWSPFVTKVEFRLRHSSATYKTGHGSPKTSPKGKIPYIHITPASPQPTTTTNESNSAEQEEVFKLGDSTAILKHFIASNTITDLNAHLSAAESLQDFSIRAMLEEKLYFYHMYERWTENYYAHRDMALGSLPLPIRAVVGLLVYRNILATLHGQGVGRHTPQETEAARREIWGIVDAALRSSCGTTTTSKSTRTDNEQAQPFWILGGEEPTEADATLFAFISSVLVSGSCPNSQVIVRGFDNVMEYAERIHHKYFSDYEKW